MVYESMRPIAVRHVLNEAEAEVKYWTDTRSKSANPENASSITFLRPTVSLNMLRTCSLINREARNSLIRKEREDLGLADGIPLRYMLDRNAATVMTSGCSRLFERFGPPTASTRPEPLWLTESSEVARDFRKICARPAILQQKQRRVLHLEFTLQPGDEVPDIGNLWMAFEWLGTLAWIRYLYISVVYRAPLVGVEVEGLLLRDSGVQRLVNQTLEIYSNERWLWPLRRQQLGFKPCVTLKGLGWTTHARHLERAEGW